MKGDFLGFSFDGIHCSFLQVTNVSNGDRYNEFLTPEFEDKIIDVPGIEGSYFFGTTYKNKPITVSIAFDSINEVQFRQLGKLLSIKKPCQLVFDERPYKVYMAKISAPPQLNYICFDEPKKTTYYIDPETGEGVSTERDGLRVIKRTEEGVERERVTPYIYTGETERIYKGEGTIEFICTYPYAIDQFKILDLYGDFDFINEGEHYKNQPRPTDNPQSIEIDEGDSPDLRRAIVNYGNSFTTYDNVQEWAAASGILPFYQYKFYHIDTVQSTNDAIPGFNAYIPLYNAGDIDTSFYLFLPYTNNGLNNAGTLDSIDGQDNILVGLSNMLVIKPFTSKTTLNTENGVIINTHNHLIEGVLYDKATSAWKTTGNLYNEYILAGDFMKIKARDWSMYHTGLGDPQKINLSCATALEAKIHYNYLYY